MSNHGTLRSPKDYPNAHRNLHPSRSSTRENVQGGHSQQRQQIDPQSRSGHKNFRYPQGTTVDSRYLTLLKNTLEEGDSIDRRAENAKQLISYLASARQHGDPIQTQQECFQILEVCLFHRTELRTIFTNKRAECPLKLTVTKLILYLGCCTGRLDMIIGWQFEQLQRWPDKVPRSKEYKIALLKLMEKVIEEAAKDANLKRFLQDLSPNIISGMITFLDAMDSGEYLIEVVRLFNLLAKHCTAAFSAKFQDIIDLLVGWHVETGINITYDQYRFYWNTRLPLAFELLHHFLNDMRDIFDAIANGAPKSKWRVCENLFSCYYAITRAVIPLIEAPESQIDKQVVNPLFDQLRPATLEFLQMVRPNISETNWLRKASDVLLLLFSVRIQDTVPFQWPVYQYICSQIPSESSMDISSCHAILRKLVKLVDAWQQSLDTNVLLDMLSVDTSPLYRMRVRFRDDKRMNSGILALLRVLLRLSSPHNDLQLQITESMQRHLVAKLEVLKHVYNQNQEVSLCRVEKMIMENLKCDHKQEISDISPLEATMDALFYAYILLDAASGWSYLRFKHILLVCSVLQVSLQSNCSVLFNSTLELFADFCGKPPYCLDCKDSLRILSELLQDIFDNWLHIKMQMRQRVCSLLAKVEHEASNLQQKGDYIEPLMKTMVLACGKAAGLERFEKIKMDMIHIVLNYCKDFGCAAIVSQVLPYIQQSLDDPRDEHRCLGMRLLCGLNPFVVADTFVDINEIKDNSMQGIVMATANTGSFRPPHFEAIMKYLGLSNLLLSANNTNLDRTETESMYSFMKKLFYRCNSLSLMQSIAAYADKKKSLDENVIKTMIDNSESFFTYWAMWESARYCILSRLRTPFGGPQQTLGAFERHLAASMSSPNKPPSQTGKLLLLLDRLELQIYNAYEGCATNAMPPAPRSSLAFFRTNRKTCKDYFAKIRPMIIHCAKQLGEYHLLIRNTMEYLKESEAGIHDKMNVRAWFSSVQTYIRDLVEVAIMLNESDMIYGVQAWYKRILRRIGHVIPSFHEEYVFPAMIGPLGRDNAGGAAQSSMTSWLSISATFALGRYEEAITALRKLQDALPQDEYGILRMLDKQATDYYTSLEDYKSLTEMRDITISALGQPAADTIAKFFQYPEDYTLADWDSLEQQLTSASYDVHQQLGRLRRLKLQSDEPHSPHVLDQQSLKRRSDIIALQLQSCSQVDLIKAAIDWESNTKASQGHLNMHTKEWGQLVCKSEDNLAPMQLAAVYLHGAKIARKQGNLVTAKAWLERAKSSKYLQSQAAYESIKLQLATTGYNQEIKSIENLGTMLGELRQNDKLFSRGCLLAAKLIKNMNPNDISKLENALEPSLWAFKDDIQSSVDAMMESMLTKATQGQVDGKAWYEFGTYHYKHAWRILDDFGREDGAATVATWARNEIQNILQISDCGLYKDFGKLLKQQMAATSLDIYQDAAFVENVRHTLASFGEDVIIRILEVLSTARSAVVDHFGASVDAFFRYMILNEKSKRSASLTMTVALRLLRTLVKYGMLAQTQFMEHIDTLPVEPWMQIIPQLFARLNHAPEFARKIIIRLIERICDKYPRRIIYDVIVGSTCSRNDRDAKNALIGIANRMKEDDNQLWISTHRMAEELEKITVLWEEQWTYQIASLTFSVMEMFSKLDSEAMRLEQTHGDDSDQINKSFLENYDGVVKFAVLSLQKLMDTTIHTRNTMTPHEQWFTRTFGSRIEEAFELLLHPQSLTTYREGWEMFMGINRDLAVETHKMRILELKNVSPYLASMQDTVIGVPGINDDPPMIMSFGNNVVVLPTKTKPKKLDLIGTDGKKHSYLFKGLEDLHLDERIMQLLTTANSLLSEDKATASRNLRSRTYAVIPLSDHSGMIQWINDATPLFALYKRWQRREQAAQILLANDKSAPEPPILRPTEIFMRKIEAALKAEGRRVTANRRHWPRYILKNVFLELLKETPGDLLAKEVWCASIDPVDWLKKSTTLGRSIAVMSIIGYIIGLGDRHLDNMMVDFATGEIIHIDYNVCFEKGRKLRVPELVPYRLTQNLFHALGVFGVDGVFRTAAEETLRVLRKHKEVLMTLLDAFVYDPLVHWNNEAGDMETRQILELQANLGLIAARLGDQKNTYESQKHAISDSLDSFLRSLKETVVKQAMEDEESDEEDTESSVQTAQQQLLAIVDECRLWHDKHIKTVTDLNEGGLYDKLQRATSMSSDLLGFISQHLGNAAGEFLASLASWIQHKTVLYHECIADLEQYRQLIRPVTNALQSQNTCQIWMRLEQLSNNGYKDDEVEEMCKSLTQSIVSPTLQAVENNVTSFAQRVLRSLATMESCLSQPSSSTNSEQLKSSIDFASIPRSKVDSCLKLLENAFRQYSGEASGNEYLEIPENLETLEAHCYFGLHSRALDSFPVFTLVTSLKEHIDTFRVHCDNNEAFNVIFACAKSVVSFNDALLECSRTLSDLIQQPETDARSVVNLLLRLIESARDEDMLHFLNTKNPKIDVHWAKVQDAFTPFDTLCNSYQMRTDLDMNDVVSLYVKLKRQILALMVQEVAKYLREVPSHAWLPPQMMAWSLSSTIITNPMVNNLTSLVTNDLLIPFTISAIESLYQMESPSLDLESEEELVNTLHQLCFSKAEEGLRKQAALYLSKYSDALKALNQDMERFQWFNAPYLQKQWPLLPSKLLVRLSDAPDKLQYTAQTLQELDFRFMHLINSLQTPMREQLQEAWTKAYRNELEKCMETMDIFNTLNHMESCRVGFTQATILYEDVLESLRVSTTAQESSQMHDNDGATMMVPKATLNDARKMLSSVTSLLSTLKSPVDGVVSLLESIIVPDIDTDNELKPAQRSAQVALDHIALIQKEVSRINGETISKRSKGDVKVEWTYAELITSIRSISEAVVELFSAIRNLEESTSSEKVAEEKDTTSKLPDQTSSSEVPLIGDIERESDDYVDGIVSPSLEDVKKDEGHATATAPATIKRNAEVMAIMQRIRAKLDGRDFGAQQRLGVSEQVAKTIEHAMSIENLSVMYEGWTSWV